MGGQRFEKAVDTVTNARWYTASRCPVPILRATERATARRRVKESLLAGARDGGRGC